MSFSHLMYALVLAAIAVAGTLLGVTAVTLVLRVRRQKWPRAWRGWARLRRPFALALCSVLVFVIAQSALPKGDWEDAVRHVTLMLAIAGVVWLAATILLYALAASEERLLERYSVDRDRRRAQTRFRLTRRLITVGFVIVGIGLVLLTFPAVNVLGAGVLASAGVLGVVFGIAAQSSLGNVFAGIQLAFSDAIRLDDLVVVEDESGRIEDITLTYVVVRIWDERRLILPSAYFITTPFTNSTRTGTELNGTVTFELDWRADIDGMRSRLDELLHNTPLWDGRSKSLQVTESIGDRLTVRIVASAGDSGDLFDLQCLIRETLVRWLREHNPEGLPVQRILRTDNSDVSAGEGATAHPDADKSV
ncbi:mechanosensitive ion channel [Microlunatus elymi]|uniref:Mechanosensitive ion channel n=1 Tax=Microlunatus elymi TaxID=2596828 RepID=A0A516Q471_9ACTN|nr:mechanosensitive ion channel domain-containing protein [Microlunatus elymi]QDP98172.1 mechanosensitive ion channel [Microlunatus elymi]